MRVLCLGPLMIGTGEHETVMHSSIRARLLVALLVHSGRTVSKERLIRELWPSERPYNTLGALQAHVSRLRRQLLRCCGARLRVEARHLGYRVAPDPDAEVDMWRFEDLFVQAGTHPDPERVLDIARRALRLWRDEPFSGLDVGPEGEAARIRLQETRLRLWETVFASALATGRAREIVADARRLAAEFPFRERFHAYLMVALYQSGRQAEALESYRRARAVAVRELGVEPSPVLGDCLSAILRHDSRLRDSLPVDWAVPRCDPA